MAAYKASLTAEETEALVRETAELKAYQEEEDSPEAVESIPLLRREDISRKTPVKLRMQRTEAEGLEILQQDYPTNGIAYLTLLFDAKKCPGCAHSLSGTAEIRAGLHPHGAL